MAKTKVKSYRRKDGTKVRSHSKKNGWAVYSADRRTPTLVDGNLSKSQAIKKALSIKKRGSSQVDLVRRLTESEQRLADKGKWVKGHNIDKDRKKLRGVGPTPLGFRLNSSTLQIEFALKPKMAITAISGYARGGKWVRGFRAARKKASPEMLKAANQALQDFSGDLPSRTQILQNTKNSLISAIRDPKKAIQQGLAREQVLIELIKDTQGVDLSRGGLLHAGLEKANADFKTLLDNPNEVFETTKKVVNTIEDTALSKAREPIVATAGLIGTSIGSSVPLPGSGVAGDFIGSRVVRRGIEDREAWKAAYQRLTQQPEFDSATRLQKFKQLQKEALNIRKEAISETKLNDLAGDTVGWAVGNTAATLSPLQVPLVGAGPGMFAALTAQNAEELVRKEGKTIGEAIYISLIENPIKRGNAREAALRSKIKDNWNRYKYLVRINE